MPKPPEFRPIAPPPLCWPGKPETPVQGKTQGAPPPRLLAPVPPPPLRWPQQNPVAQLKAVAPPEVRPASLAIQCAAAAARPRKKGPNPRKARGAALRSGRGKDPADVMREQMGGIPVMYPPADIRNAVRLIVGNRRPAKRAPGFKWGVPFENRSVKLPGTTMIGGYLEYYLEPTHPEDLQRGGFGSRRLLVHEETGFAFYTEDHYGANKNIGAEAPYYSVGRIDKSRGEIVLERGPAAYPPMVVISPTEAKEMEALAAVAASVLLPPDDGKW